VEVVPWEVEAVVVTRLHVLEVAVEAARLRQQRWMEQVAGLLFQAVAAAPAMQLVGSGDWRRRRAGHGTDGRGTAAPVATLPSAAPPLTPDTAAVLSRAAADASRRRHAHTTPLHAAAALLSGPAPLLRDAGRIMEFDDCRILQSCL
jgi:hypothetical protein